MEEELQGKLDTGETVQITDVAQKTAQLLASGDDDEKLSRIQAALQAATEQRSKELDAQREVLRGAPFVYFATRNELLNAERMRTEMARLLFCPALARQYEAQKAATVRPVSVPSEEEHQETLSMLDARKLQHAKHLANLEQETANAENKLSLVKEQVHQSQGQDPVAGSAAVGTGGDLCVLAPGRTPVFVTDVLP